MLKCCIFCTLKILFSGYFQSKLGSNKVHSWTSLEGKTETKFDNIKGYVLSFLAYTTNTPKKTFMEKKVVNYTGVVKKSFLKKFDETKQANCVGV